MKVKILIISVVVIILLVGILLFLGRRIDVKTNKKVSNLSEELQEIFYLGSLAPNSHNIQSWEVTVYPNDEYVVVSADPDKKLDVIDPKGREVLISLGCYAETLMKSFEAYGYNTEFSFDEEKKEITLKYHKAGEKVDLSVADLIKKRHTDKRAFNDQTLSSTYLSSECESLDPNFYFEKGSSEFEAIKKSTMDAYIAQANNKEAAKELSDWLRLSNEETIKTKDGLPAEQLGILGIKKSLYYLTTNHESATGDSFSKQGIDTTKKQLEGCAGFCVLSSDNTEKQLVDCGMQTVKLWLELTDSGISVQPMSYAIEEKEYRDNLQSTLGIDNIQMILRIGFTSDYGSNAGIRRDLADYISVK
ncbi:MAG: hypothetical protein IK121_03565 [Lachnospiraceae bacterium]|nr:hypothetical protein [Lachnospiraceae bacterium]